MKRLFFICIMFLFLLVGCSLGENNQDSDENSEKNSKAKATDKMKSFKMGQVVEADGIDIKVVKAEFINSYDEFSAPKNGKALRVYIKFKNNNDDQVLIDNTDFGMKVNNENYEEWYSSDDMHEGFSHQLNHNNTASGYITYDVPDSDNYTLELDAIPNFNKVRAKWVINKSDISNSDENNSTSGNSSAREENTSTNDSDDSATDDDSTDAEEEDEGVTYPASMYNDLVDEYNSLTDGEKMNHVSKDVLEIEYDQLEARVEALYEKEEEKYEKQAAKEEAEYERQQAKEEAEFEKEQAEEEAEYEKQQAEEEAKAEQEEQAEEEAKSAESSSDEEDANSEDNAA